MLFRVTSEILKSDSRISDRSGPDTEIFLQQFIERGQIRKARLAVNIQHPLHPLFFIPPFSVLLTNAEALGHFGTDSIIAFSFGQGLEYFWHQDNFIPVFPAVLESPGFKLSASGKHHIGEAGARRHKLFMDNNKFDQALIA